MVNALLGNHSLAVWMYYLRFLTLTHSEVVKIAIVNIVTSDQCPQGNIRFTTVPSWVFILSETKQILWGWRCISYTTLQTIAIFSIRYILLHLEHSLLILCLLSCIYYLLMRWASLQWSLDNRNCQPTPTLSASLCMPPDDTFSVEWNCSRRIFINILVSDHSTSQSVPAVSEKVL